MLACIGSATTYKPIASINTCQKNMAIPHPEGFQAAKVLNKTIMKALGRKKLIPDYVEIQEMQIQQALCGLFFLLKMEPFVQKLHRNLLVGR